MTLRFVAVEYLQVVRSTSQELHCQSSMTVEEDSGSSVHQFVIASVSSDVTALFASSQ